MSRWQLPGVRVAVPFLLGTLASGLEPARPLLALTLLGLALALGGAAGRALAIAAAALALGWLRPDADVGSPHWLDPRRPVEVRARLVRPWQPSRFGWNAVVRVETLRQGDRVALWPTRLGVDLGSDPPAPSLRRLQLKGQLGRAPGLGNDPPLPPGRWRLRVKSARLITAAPGRSGPTAALEPLRRHIGGLFDRSEPSAGVTLARALVLGDTSRLDRDLLLGLRRLGLGHLLAVSGLHVGIAGWVLWVASGPLPRALRRATPFVGAGCYLALVGPRPAILRAALMVALAARSLARGRPPQGLNALAWALTAILLLDPAVVSDLGFALTAAATAGIVGLGAHLERRWRRLPRGLRRALAAAVGAQVAAMPFTLSRFHVMTPLTPALNLVALPWTALTLAASFLWLAAAAFGPWAAEACRPVVDSLALPYEWPASLSPRQAAIGITGGGWIRAVVVTLGVAAALFGSSWRRRGASLVAALIVLLLPRPGPGVEVVMLDVGQGESILVRDGRRALLVDGGGWHRLDIAQRVLVPALARLGVRRLDAVVISHPDLDHCRGLVEISAYLPVAEVWSATGLESTDCLDPLRLGRGLRWRPLWRGRRVALGAWRFEVLHPPPTTRGGGNDRSLVLRAVAADRALLLTGDLGRRGERRLLGRARPPELRAEVLKVAHHGSSSSSSEAFLRAVSPRLALVSAGRGNSYGHPSTEVLDRLERRGVRVLRTDRDGMIRLSW